jgi:hypothetical protein
MRICSIEGCGKKHDAKGLCNKHYLQFKYYGGVKRTVKDPNEFIIDTLICSIHIFDKAGVWKYTAIVGREDYDLVKKYKWGVSKNQHGVLDVRTSRKAGSIPLSRMLMGLSKGDKTEVDHKNRDRLDNRIENLRLCNRSQNTCNTKYHKNRHSQYRGVNLVEGTRWRAVVTKDKKHHHCGYFDTEIQAALAYNEAAQQLHGEFAYLNKIGD